MADIYLRHWGCADAKAVIVLVHGLGEFCDRYDWAATQFTKRGYAVIGADLPGHGKTTGKRGHIDTFDEFYTPLRLQLQQAAELYPEKPVVLFGHSMGGLAVVRFLQTQEVPPQVQAVLLSSPCLRFAFNVPPIQLRVLQIMSKLWPTFPQATRIAPADVTRSPEVQTFYRTNSLILHKVSVRLLSEFYNSMEASRAAHKELHVPILVMQAGADKLADPAASRQFVADLVTADKEFRLYPEYRHELLNEPEREEILQEMTAWLDEKLPMPT